MHYRTTDFSEVDRPFDCIIFNSLGKNNTLYVPEHIPQVSQEFLSNLPQKSAAEVGVEVLWPFVQEVLGKEELQQICHEALNFPLPLVFLNDDISVLELFHGPTKAFKDVGARVMARLLSILKKDESPLTILAATSGDTGSAVANGFFNVEGIQVVLLFPKGMVSPYQEHQMTTLGGNIYPVEIEGSFDDCQALVKRAFTDPLNESMNLASANSINMARLLPQMVYYFYSFGQLTEQQKKCVNYCVPSGNLGNLTAGLYAKKMGLPIKKFIAAENRNNSFHRYLQSGVYEPESTIKTFSNAMDVGAPSNFARILDLYESNLDNMRKDIQTACVSDENTLQIISEIFEQKGYQLDPHGAVGYKAAKSAKIPGHTVVLETAHPFKFENVMQKAIPDFSSPVVDLSKAIKSQLPANYDQFKGFLTDLNA